MPPTRFVGEPITVAFDQPPLFAKQPSCPARFIWREETFEIVANLQEWRDYGRRGAAVASPTPEGPPLTSLVTSVDSMWPDKARIPRPLAWANLG